MAESILKKHQLDITVGVELNDAQRKATSTQIKNMASQWQDILDDAIKKGIEDGARSASLKDVLTQFNAQLKAFKLEPLTITVDELQIMDKPIEHAAKLVIQKLGNSFKGGGLGNIISSEITDSLDTIGGAVDKIYQKMEQNAKKSAKNIAKSMYEIEEAAKKVSRSRPEQNKIHNAIGAPVSVPNDSKKRKEQFSKLYSTSKTASEDGSSWVKQYAADVKFVRGFQKLTEEQKTEVYGKNLAAVQAYYDKLEAMHEQKMIALNNVLALNDYTKINKAGKITTQYNFKTNEPWAREKTLQEVKQILSGGLTVKGDTSGDDGGKSSPNPDGKNLNSVNPEKDSTPKTNINSKPESQSSTKYKHMDPMYDYGMRAVHKPKDSEGPIISREQMGGSYFADEDSIEEFDSDYGRGFDKKTGSIISARFKALNALIVDAENQTYDEIDKLKEMKYLFPGVEDFERQDDIGKQKFYNEKMRDSGFDFFKAKNMSDDADLSSDIMVPLQEMIVEYSGEIPDYYEVEKITPELERILISQQKGSAERWYNETIDRLQQQFDSASQKVDSNHNEQDFKKHINISEEEMAAYNDLPDILSRLKTMRDDAMSRFDTAIDPLGGYIDEEVQKGLPQIIQKKDNGELFAKTSERYIQGVLQQISELGKQRSKLNSDTKAFRDAETQIDLLQQEILSKVASDTLESIEDMLYQLQDGEIATSDVFAALKDADITYRGPDMTSVASEQNNKQNRLSHINNVLGGPGTPDKENISGYRKLTEGWAKARETSDGLDSENLIKYIQSFEKVKELGTKDKKWLDRYMPSDEDYAKYKTIIDSLQAEKQQLETEFNTTQTTPVANINEEPVISDIDKIKTAWQNLITYIGGLDGTPEMFFQNMETDVQKMDADLRGLLTSIGAIDSEGNLHLKAISTGFQNWGGVISDTHTLIARPMEYLGKSEELIPKLDMAKQMGASVGDIIQIYKDEAKGLIYELQNTMKGKNIIDPSNTAFLEATDDQIQKLIHDLEILHKTGLYVDFGGDNILYDDKTGFSFIDLATRPKEGQETVNGTLKQFESFMKSNGVAESLAQDFMDKISSILNGVIDNDPTDTTPPADEVKSGDKNGGDSNLNSEVLTNLNTTLTNLVAALNKENANVTAAINTEELGSVLHDGRPYLVDANGKSEDTEANKVSIDTEGLQSVLTAITFKIQDVSEKESVNSAIDQESINNLVGAIKTAITPQNDNTPKDSGPWAREETLRNITGSILGKIANNMPKVDTKNLAKNDILNRVAQATEAINGKISGKITGSIKDIAQADKAAADAKKAKEAEEKKAQKAKEKADHKAAVQQLNDEYKELGKLRAQRDAMSSSTERTKLQQEIKSKGDKLRKRGISLGVDSAETKKIADAAQTEEAAAIAKKKAEEAAAIAEKEHAKAYDELIDKIKERNKLQEQSAGLDKKSNVVKDNKPLIDGLNQEIEKRQKNIKLTKEEQAEIDKLNAKSEDTVRNKNNKAQDRDDAKAFREEVKQLRKKNNVDIANNRFNAGRRAMDDLWKLDDAIDPSAIPEVTELRAALVNLESQYNAVNRAMQNGDAISDEEIADLNRSSGAVAEKTAKLKEMLAHYEKFKDAENIGQYVPGAADEETQLKNAINQQFGGKAKVKGFERDASGFLTAAVEVKEGARAFTEYKVAVQGADGSIRALKGNTKQLPSFLDSVKRKLGEISQYVSAMSVISRLGQELRRGLQYVREIDLALTELKKVTDETAESYEQFLDTASKVGERLGATISEVTEATATFAKLGYNMKQATEMAESAIVYKNVGDNIASTEDAADSIISTLKGFNLNASESMRIVNAFNEVGNRFAITSQGIGEALRLSASALSEGGNSLDESIGLITAANEVVQDPSSVGTALKTLTLRLRGSKTELEEIGEDVSGMAETTSSLQAKLLALTGGQVDIMLNETTFKNSTQILREMADAWEDMDDISRASALELMGGKRQANVLSALIQNFDTVEDAIESSANSAGSALRENEKYLDSIQGRIDQFNNALQTMWSNVLDDDIVKIFVQIGTELIKILDSLGPIKTLLAGIVVYAMRKNGIAGFGDIFKTSVTSIDALREKLAKLRQDYDKLDGSKSQKTLRKQDALGSKIKEIEAEIEAYDKLAAKRDEAFKKRDATQTKLKEAQDDLTDAWAQGETGNIDSDDLDKLAQRVEDAKVEFEKADMEAQEFDKTVKKTGKTGSTTFANLGTGVKNFTKELIKSLGQMLVMWAIMKVFQVISGWLDDIITTAEEAAEAFEELTNELEDTKQAIKDIEGELEAINDKIAEINSQESLSFVDEEELARLKEERAELERELELNKELAKQKQQQVNNQVSGQVEYYRNQGVDSGKTTGERSTSGANTGALIGAGAGYLAAGAASAAVSAGGAAAGAKLGGIVGTLAGPLGTAIGIAIGTAVGLGIGAATGAILGATEEKVGERIENMGDNLVKKEEELEKARSKYQKSGKDGDREKYEEAQKALSDYRGEMAKYFTDMDAMYKNVDLKTIEDPDEYARLKKEMEDFYNERDKWLIKSGAEGAKVNAIERIFDKEELKEASSNIDALLQKLKENPGDNTILALIANQAGLAKEDLEAVGVSVEDAIAYFTQFSSGIDMSAMVDPMKTAMSAIDTYTSKMETLASIQAEVANGFMISAEKAREFAAMYPEILQGAKVAANGQIQLNAGVVNALLSGERAEADAAMETDKQKIEGTIATLEAKKSYLEAQLAIMEAEAEGNRQLAINQVEIMQERYNQAVEANIGEAESYKLAMENMGLNATEFNKVVADVANDTSANMSGAASQMSIDMYDGYSAGADSANAFGMTASNAANAINNPLWRPLPFGSRTIGGSGGFKSNVTNGSFTGLQIDKKILDVKFDNLKLNLTNQLDSVNEAIANAYGALTLMDTNIQAPLSSFDPDKDSGKDDAPTKFEKMQAAYEAALANLEHRQEMLQGEIDILEAQRKGVSSKYYKELIQGENDKIDLYEGQLELFRALLDVTPKTNEEYNDIVETIHELERNIQEAALAAIEFGEALNANQLKGIQDIGDAYENLYNINDRQKGSMELYKEGVEIGGGYVNERWYDDMIAKAGEAGDLARQELTDSLWAIDQYRNQKNPFEVGTAEYEGFEFDRNKNLQEAWAQAADAKDKIQEADNEALQLAEDKKDAYIEAWENVATGFERIGTLFENQISLIDGYESRLEALNINVSDAVYEKKIGTQKNILDNLDEQIAYDENMLAEYAAKYGTNDERYITKWEELNEKRVQRYEAETEIIQIEQQIIDNQIDRFNQTIDRMNDAVDKMNNIKGLVSDEKVADENGDWTAEGLTQAGMNFQEMTYQKEMIAAYAEQMEELTELYEEGKISEKEYYEQMKELEDGQWSAIDAYKAAEDAIINLEEARIDTLENGLQEEIDAYAELIELKKEELDAERDLFEFRRDVEDQSKNIAEIQRRMASISNSSADEDRAEYKRLEKELYEAERGLDDTYRNRSYDSTSQALDDELSAFENSYTDYIDRLRESLENTDELIKQIYSDVVTNGQLVLETLVQLSDEHGFTLDTNLTAPWRNATGESLTFEEDASAHYNRVKTTVELGTAGFVENIEKPWKRGQEESEVFAKDAETYLQAALDSAKAKKDEMSSTVCQPWEDAQKLIAQGPTWVSNAAYNILQVVKQNVKDINAEYAKIKSPGAQLSGDIVSGGGNETPKSTYNPAPYVPPKQDPPKQEPKKETTKKTTTTVAKKPTFKEVGNMWSGVGHTGVSIGKKSYNKSLEIEGVNGIFYPYTNGNGYKGYIKKGEGYTVLGNGKMDIHSLKPIYAKYAKGTLGTTKDQFAITDEPQYGDELVLVPSAAGNLSFMRKGTGVVPADLTKRIMEIAQMPAGEFGNNIVKAIVPNIETTNQAVQVNFEALVKTEHIDSDIMGDVEKMVEKQLNNFTRNLNYAIKKYK